jgi:hypothetical protein
MDTNLFVLALFQTPLADAIHQYLGGANTSSSQKI